MAITIQLYAYEDDNPFTTFQWDVDFEAGVSAIVVNVDPLDFPVSVISSGPSYSVGLNWSVTFTPALTDSALAGAMVSTLLGDGDVVIGSSYADILRMTSHNDKVSGGDGNDVIYGRGGDDHLVGGYGDDYLEGGPGADILEGGNGGDTYRIDAFDTIIERFNDYGQDTVEVAFSYTAPGAIENIRLLGSEHIVATGNDDSNILWGNDGDNTLYGVGDDDELYGGAGNDTLYGGVNDDKLYGGTGDDVLYGGEGYIDKLDGGDGNDRLIGGKGDDTLTGGAGADRFVFDHHGSRWYGDYVTDFSRGEGDRIILDRDAFTKLKKAGPLKKKFFDVGDKKANDKNDYIVYHKKRGELYYDPDGSGRKKAYVIAEFEGNPKLKASDFDII